MHSRHEPRERAYGRPPASGRALLCSFLALLCSGFFGQALPAAEVLERVVAFVDERAITLSDLNATQEKMRKAQPAITRDEVISAMLNRLLILNEARRLKLTAKSDEDLLNEYLELKVRAFVRIKEEAVEAYYRENRQEFGNTVYEAVRESIEEYLTQREINRLLKEHLARLRAKAFVRILADEQLP